MNIIISVTIALILAVLGLVGYFIYYRAAINKNLNKGKVGRRLAPRSVAVLMLAVFAVLAVGFILVDTLSNTSGDESVKTGDIKYDYCVLPLFDPLFDNAESADINGYSLKIHVENDIEICILQGNNSEYMPNFAIRVRYLGVLPELDEGENLDLGFGFYTHDNLISQSGFCGSESVGSYSEKYIIGKVKGNFDLKISVWLRVSKTKHGDPFAATSLYQSISG